MTARRQPGQLGSPAEALGHPLPGVVPEHLPRPLRSQPSSSGSHGDLSDPAMRSSSAAIAMILPRSTS